MREEVSPDGAWRAKPRLSANELERLRRYRSEEDSGRFSTWLVAVVHNRTIDWLRAQVTSR